MTRFERHIRELADEIGIRDMRLYPDLGRMGAYSRSSYNDRDPVGAACSIPGFCPTYRGDYGLVAPWVQVFNFRPKSPASYFCVLHELGHVDLRHLENGYNQRGDAYMVECESEAWLWAFEHALIEPDKRTMALIRGPWLGSYRRYRGPGYGPAWHQMAALTGLS